VVDAVPEIDDCLLKNMASSDPVVGLVATHAIYQRGLAYIPLWVGDVIGMWINWCIHTLRWHQAW
jgi:hypothetical protein